MFYQLNLKNPRSNEFASLLLEKDDNSDNVWRAIYNSKDGYHVVSPWTPKNRTLRHANDFHDCFRLNGLKTKVLVNLDNTLEIFWHITEDPSEIIIIHFNQEGGIFKASRHKGGTYKTLEKYSEDHIREFFSFEPLPEFQINEAPVLQPTEEFKAWAITAQKAVSNPNNWEEKSYYRYEWADYIWYWEYIGPEAFQMTTERVKWHVPNPATSPWAKVDFDILKEVISLAHWTKTEVPPEDWAKVKMRQPISNYPGAY